MERGGGGCGEARGGELSDFERLIGHGAGGGGGDKEEGLGQDFPTYAVEGDGEGGIDPYFKASYQRDSVSGRAVRGPADAKVRVRLLASSFFTCAMPQTVTTSAIGRTPWNTSHVQA